MVKATARSTYHSHSLAGPLWVIAAATAVLIGLTWPTLTTLAAIAALAMMTVAGAVAMVRLIRRRWARANDRPLKLRVWRRTNQSQSSA